MRDDRDIQRPKPASAPEKGRGPLCGKDRRSATVCPCRHVPTCHGFPTKAFQVAPLVVHLARNSRESVPGVTSCLPPGTESPQKRSRCPSLLPTCHGIPAKAFQVSFSASHLPRFFLQKRSRCLFPPSTCHGIPAKVFQVSLPAIHLPRNSRKSVPSVSSRRPPATEFPRKRSRCHFLPPTCYGFPAKVCQVSPSAVHLARYSRKSVPGVLSCRPPATEFPRKCVRWHLPASYLPRFSYESVPGSTSCRPPGTEFPRKCVRCLIRLPPATAVHLITGCWGFSVGHVAVFSMKRATISTPAAAEYMYLSENHDVQKKVQLQVSHI